MISIEHIVMELSVWLVNRSSDPATHILHSDRRNIMYQHDTYMNWREVASSIRWTADNHIDRRTRA